MAIAMIAVGDRRPGRACPAVCMVVMRRPPIRQPAAGRKPPGATDNQRPIADVQRVHHKPATHAVAAQQQPSPPVAAGAHATSITAVPKTRTPSLRPRVRRRRGTTSRARNPAMGRGNLAGIGDFPNRKGHTLLATLLSCDHLAIGSGGTAGVGYVGIARIAIPPWPAPDAYTVAWLPRAAGGRGDQRRGHHRPHGGARPVAIDQGANVGRETSPSRIFSMRSIDRAIARTATSDISVRTIVRSILSLGGLSSTPACATSTVLPAPTLSPAVTNLSEERASTSITRRTRPSRHRRRVRLAPSRFHPWCASTRRGYAWTAASRSRTPTRSQRSAPRTSCLQTQKNAQTDSIFHSRARSCRGSPGNDAAS